MAIWNLLEISNVVPYLERLYSHLRRRGPRKSWGEVLKMLERLHTQMRAQSFHPDVVVGIDREGSIVASIFAFNWRLKPYCALDRTFVITGHDRTVEIIDTIRDESIKGRKVLIIDCEVNTGTTMRAAKDFITRKKGAVEVRTMALGASITSTLTPDYVAFEFAQRPYWPWEYTEETRLLRHTKTWKEAT